MIHIVKIVLKLSAQVRQKYVLHYTI